MAMPRTDSMERFMDKVLPEPMTGCWLWAGAVSWNGYGKFSERVGPGRNDFVTAIAHRWIMEQEYGPIPPGLQVDHICRVRCCVNPRHLRMVSARENLLALGSLSPTKRLADRTHCKNGHEFIPANTRMINGVRVCKTCDRERSLRYYYERKEQKGRVSYIGMKPPLYEGQIQIRNAVNSPQGRQRNAPILNMSAPPEGPIDNSMEAPIPDSVQIDSYKPGTWTINSNGGRARRRRG